MTGVVFFKILIIARVIMIYYVIYEKNTQREPRVIMAIYKGEEYRVTGELVEDFGDFLLELVEEQLADQ